MWFLAFRCTFGCAGFPLLCVGTLWVQSAAFLTCVRSAVPGRHCSLQPFWVQRVCFLTCTSRAVPGLHCSV